MPVTSTELFFEAAHDAARRLVDFESYGSSRVRARAALRRRIPGLERDRHDDALDQAIALHGAALDAARAHPELVASRWTLLHGVDDELAVRFPGAPIDTIRSALTWVIYWHHRR